MIIFHEGLPGSGKSYEAMYSRIVPSLKNGRPVVAYVEGLNFEKIAALAGITVERCRELLTALTREDVQKDWLSCMKPNAMHILDEAQNFWGNKRKFSEAETQMVTEHRHQGMDIVLMGQDLRDVHATWRRRVELKLCFLKLNGFGRLLAKKYSCTSYRHLGGDEFKRIGLKVMKYDERYFGTYKSHVSADTNTEDYADERTQVLNHPLLKYVIPVALVVGAWAAWSAWKYFHPEQPPTKTETKAQGAQSFSASPPSSRASAATAASAVQLPRKDERPAIERRMSELGQRGRIRLAGLIRSPKHISGVIEWVEGGSVVFERMSLDTLRGLGVGVLVTDDSAVQLAIGDYRELATPWPLQDLGRVSEARQEAIRGPRELRGDAPVSASIGSLGSSQSRDLPGNIKSSNVAKR